jgi:hypothetical protein
LLKKKFGPYKPHGQNFSRAWCHVCVTTNKHRWKFLVSMARISFDWHKILITIAVQKNNFTDSIPRWLTSLRCVWNFLQTIEVQKLKGMLSVVTCEIIDLKTYISLWMYWWRNVCNKSVKSVNPLYLPNRCPRKECLLKHTMNWFASVWGKKCSDHYWYRPVGLHKFSLTYELSLNNYLSSFSKYPI